MLGAIDWQAFTFSLSSKKRIDKTSLEARKKLCMPRLRQDEHLNLKKAAIQMIIKKQRYFRTSQILLDQKNLFQFGLSGGKILLKTKGTNVGPQSLTLHEISRYQQICLKEKRIRTLCMEGDTYLPILMFKTLESLRSLQTLNLYLRLNEFAKFPNALRSLMNLKKLSLTILAKDQNETGLDLAISEFSKNLLSRRFLISLELLIKSIPFLASEERATVLLNTISDLNLSYFKVTLPTNVQTMLNPSKIQSFLKKLEYLARWNSLPIEPHIPQNRILFLLGRRLSNFTKILMECSSLQSLNFEIPSTTSDICTTLGQAKGITELKIAFPRHNIPVEIYHHASRLVSEASNLNSLFLENDHFQHLSSIHDSLRTHPKIKSYTLYSPSNYSLKNESISFKDICQQIGMIRSLEELILHCRYVDEGASLSLLFTNLSSLKKLSIKVQAFDQKAYDFPFESLGSLDSIQDITISYPKVLRDKALPRLPKMPNLESLQIQDCSDFFRTVIDINDYNNKFSVKKT